MQLDKMLVSRFQLWILFTCATLCQLENCTEIDFIGKYLGASLDDVTVRVNSMTTMGMLDHLWKSTGLCPPKPYQNASQYLLTQDMTLNLILIGAMSPRGLLQVRIHWLLNLVDLTVEDGTLHYDFANLDTLIDRLHANGLKPGFELMGNPSRHFSDFEDRSQLYQWRDMVTTLAKHYIGRHGVEYVQQWNFESWNEPDHMDFDGLNFTLQGFLNYYDACSEGLRLAHPTLRLGGPAESFRGKFVNFCWKLLEHCAEGKNYFTGQTGVRLDFISMHKKGNDSAMSILDEELETITEIHTRFPILIDRPIYNNEADPMVGWWKPEKWRSDNTYASIVVKVIEQHLSYNFSGKHIQYRLLSNDNGFLNFYPSFFEQRTLLTRFQMNTTSPHTVQMIRKPVYIVTALILYLLGEEQVQTVLKLELVSPTTLEVSQPLTTQTHQIAEKVVIYNSNDLNSSAENTAMITIRINQLKNVSVAGDELMYVTYTMDNDRTNPAAIYEQMGRPTFPTDKQFRILRDNEGPIYTTPKPVKPIGRFKLSVKLKQPGFIAVHICSKAKLPPGRVTNVRVHGVSSTDVIVTWRIDKVQTRCIKTYEIQFASGDGQRRRPYRRINERSVIFTSFQFSSYHPRKKIHQTNANDVRGFYRVRAVDYWNRAGPWSKAHFSDYFPSR